MLVNLSFDDYSIAQKLAKGDEDAFVIVYKQYKFQIRNLVLKFVKSPDLAEDITQEVFIKVWENKERLSEIVSIKAYIFTMARNHTINVLKRAAGQEIAKSEIIKHYQRQSTASTDDQMLSQEYKLQLNKILEALPVQTRNIFVLCKEQDKSYEEVASLLGISRNAVKKHIVRSLKAFRNMLRSDLDISY